MKYSSTRSSLRKHAKAGTHTPRPLDFWALGVDTFYKATDGGGYGSLLSQCFRRDDKKGCSNLAVEVLLHPIGHLDQPSPRLFEKRHHAIHVAVTRQRNFDFALTLGHFRLGLP